MPAFPTDRILTFTKKSNSDFCDGLVEQNGKIAPSCHKRDGASAIFARVSLRH